MHLLGPRRRTGAFTLIELLCVIAIITILAGLLLPTLGQGKARALRIKCVSDLSQMGIAFHSFMHDHGGQFPMGVSTNFGGSLEYTQSGYLAGGEFYFGYHHFQSLSSELPSPKLFACPTDSRRPADSFASLRNENVSYFVGVKADYSMPGSILAGDRNITNNARAPESLVQGGIGTGVRWTDGLHMFKGNLLFADGHAEYSKDLLASLPDSRLAQNDFVLPSVKSSAIASRGYPSYGGPTGTPSSPPPRQPAPAQASPAQPNPAQPNPAMGSRSPSQQAERAPEVVPSNLPLTPVLEAPKPDETIAESAPAVTNLAVAMADSPEDGMSDFDRRFVATAHRVVFVAGFWLLLLMLLLLGIRLYLKYRRLLLKRQRIAELRAGNQYSHDD